MGAMTPAPGGAPMTLAVTGAGGFLGRRVVACARARGHRVRALLRGAPPGDWAGDPGIEVLRLDLACRGARVDRAVQGAAAVVHAAGSFAGDAGRMERDTLAATRALLDALPVAGTPRMVLVSSLSVYGAGAPGGVVDESSALEARPALRDGYARAKIAQEAMVRAGVARPWVLRAGALFGPGRLWNAHLGIRLGPVLLRTGAGPIPVAYVEHAALACVLAAETPGGGTVNVVDDDLPDARRFLAALGARGPRLALPLPWRALDALAWGGARAPGLLRRPTLRARMMPRRWPNRALRERLGWSPRWRFEEAVARSLAAEGGS